MGICEEIDIENTIVDPFRDDCMRFAQAAQAGLIRCEQNANLERGRGVSMGWRSGDPAGSGDSLRAEPEHALLRLDSTQAIAWLVGWRSLQCIASRILVESRPGGNGPSSDRSPARDA